MSLYSADKRHYVADVGSRLYTTFPYYAAKSVAVLPFVILKTLVRLRGLPAACLPVPACLLAALLAYCTACIPYWYISATSPANQPRCLAPPQVCTYTAYGMIGLRPVPSAMAINGGASMLIYLVAHQVGARALAPCAADLAGRPIAAVTGDQFFAARTPWPLRSA
jgi:hypothetical protein